MTFLIDFIIAFTLSSILMPIIMRTAKTKGLYDTVDERKIHSGSIARLGGIGIFWGFFWAIAITVLVARFWRGSSYSDARFWIFLAGGAGFHALGIFDDIRNLNGRVKFLVQTALAILVVSAGYSFKAFELPGLTEAIRLGWFGPLVTIVWIVGISNAINLLDGMDGMAGGISFIGFGIWAAYYLKDGQYLPTVVALAGAGATLGFLFYNFPPANIFMGDSGSLFLGYVLALLPLIGVDVSASKIRPLAAITVCLLPILDTLAAVLRRWRLKVSFFTPDKYHLHHKLLDIGLSNRQVLAYIYSACAMLGATVLASVYVDAILGTILMLGSWVVGAIIFIVLHYLKKRSMRASLDGGRNLQNHTEQKP